MMIAIDDTPVDHVEMMVSAPFSLDDLTAAHDSLRRLAASGSVRRMLVQVKSIALPQPAALWEDLKITPVIRHIRWVAVVTDIEWYARLAEMSGALWPNLTIKHFEPDQTAEARAWLSSHV